ncbi:speriolin-like protein [Leptodactylus fuscus]|uniref:speriolin-like protein n=1 Tax=Leptodactylus fuscus TaxID=238119 RepID=UPI003F4E9595
MSSGASGTSGANSMDKIVDILKTDVDVDTLTSENERLLFENAKLRKLMGLMQENVELRITLRDHVKKIRNLSPPRKSKKDTKDKDKKLFEMYPHADTKYEARCPPPDPEKVKQCKSIVGEIAFQLDRGILCAIFREQYRLYGYRVANIKEKIIQVTTSPLTGNVDDHLRSELNQRYHHIMDQLKKLGYDPEVHPYYTEYLVNTYGIMKERTTTEDMSFMNDPQTLRKMIIDYMVSEKVEDLLIILNCLAYLAKQNGNSMFTWSSGNL